MTFFFKNILRKKADDDDYVCMKRSCYGNERKMFANLYNKEVFSMRTKF